MFRIFLLAAVSFHCADMAYSSSGSSDSKLTYASYLQTDRLLSSQKPNSDVHDEHLFIIVHQAFELWFKQILHDLDSVRSIFHGKTNWKEIEFHTAINRLQRVVLIKRLVVEHFHILETMPPLNFVDFRDSLTGGSGFQSLQFRQIEKLFGIRDKSRILYERKQYTEKMDSCDSEILSNYPDQAGGGSLFDVINSWLQTTPGLNDTSFWIKYQEKTKGTVDLDPVLNEERFARDLEQGNWRLSQKSVKGALLIILNQDKPEFHQAYQLLTLLMDIDVALMKWRSTHIHMVHRMIGQKQGTGGKEGTSGYEYLRSTYTDEYKVFRDLFKLATYMRPRNEIPELNILSN